MTDDEFSELLARRPRPPGSVNIAENLLVTLGWSEIMGGYTTTDTMV